MAAHCGQYFSFYFSLISCLPFFLVRHTHIIRKCGKTAHNGVAYLSDLSPLVSEFTDSLSSRKLKLSGSFTGDRSWFLVGNWCALDCELSLFIYFYIFMEQMTDDVLSLSPPLRLSVFPQCSKHQLLRLEPYPILLLNWMSLPHIYLICSPVVDTGFIFVL